MFSVVSTVIGLGSALGLGFMQASRAQHYKEGNPEARTEAHNMSTRNELQALHK